MQDTLTPSLSPPRGYLFSASVVFVARTASLSVSPRIVASRDEFSERGAAPAAAWPRFQRAAAGSSTTAAVHFGCGFAALRCIAGCHPAGLRPGRDAGTPQSPCRFAIGDTAD